jgi:hypothetical protein
VFAGGDANASACACHEIDDQDVSPEERIRQRAYELYLRRGNQSGSELDDWLQAEKEFLQDEAIDEDAAEMFGQP